MKRTITLNANDIKDIISKEFNVNKDSIHFRVYSASQDGPCYSGPSCFFEFEEDNNVDQT